jgi:hypothetical protein
MDVLHLLVELDFWVGIAAGFAMGGWAAVHFSEKDEPPVPCQKCRRLVKYWGDV